MHDQPGYSCQHNAHHNKHAKLDAVQLNGLDLVEDALALGIDVLVLQFESVLVLVGAHLGWLYI